MSDLRDTIRAAMQGGEAPEAPEAAPVEAAAPEVAEVAELEAKPDDGAADRDEKGRFKPKDAAAPEAAAAEPSEQQISEPESPADQEPPKEATRVPPSLPAAVKAKWATLEPEVQAAFTKLEESVQTSKAEWGRKAERLNRLEEIIAPHRDAWAVQGLDDQQALTRLVAAEQVLRTNPTQGIVYLAQTYGVDLNQFAQTNGASAYAGQPYAQPAQAPSLDPALQPLLERFQTLEQRLAQQEQTEAEQRSAALQSQIAEFAAKPENMYFENVREDVATLLETGRADSLQDAYDKAVWLNPETRSLLIAEQDRKRDAAAKEAAKKADADARAKAQAAQRASGSVTGAPSPGASAPRPGSTGNLRADLEAAFKEHQAAV